MRLDVYPKIVSKEDFKLWEKGDKIWSFIENKLVNTKEIPKEELEDKEEYSTFDNFFDEQVEEENSFYEYLLTPKGEEVVVFGKIYLDSIF